MTLRSTLLLALALAACRKEEPAFLDLDADGVTADLDCDDTDATVFPGAEERCDGLDNDCDAEIDEEAVDTLTYFRDADLDGFGDPADTTTACQLPDGFADNDGDCDDTSEDFHPGAPEADCADPNDYNCDGSVGFADADADGVPACRECDDADPDRFPGNPESCDEVDNDCNYLVDDAPYDAATFYADLDGDGHGDPQNSALACQAPEGWLSEADDCDDLEARAFPGNAETCDGLDNDCDGSVDLDAQDAPTWYADADGDQYGDTDAALVACEAAEG
ncbi:MAG: putative metal-binding motif-containing protein, partial [Deltaproteobacteria bacterium]|nr:putative metal-binding motif-containing protein [Deltaproteobacteria bacterium]